MEVERQNTWEQTVIGYSNIKIFLRRNIATHGIKERWKMLRKWKVFEGNTDEPQRLGRWYWDYECTCDKCGTELSLEDKVQTDGNKVFCLDCADGICTVEELL